MSDLRRAIGMVFVAVTVLSGTAAAQDADAPDRALLETLCVANAPSEELVAVCLDVVRSILVPAEESRDGSPVPLDVVELGGAGDTTSRAFRLSGGSYLATLIATDPDDDGRHCSVYGSLNSASSNREVQTIRTNALDHRQGEVTSFFYAVPEDRYYFATDLTDCRWTLDLTRMVAHNTDMPGKPISRSGSDTLNTGPLVLPDGDYVIDYSVTAPKDGECHWTAWLIPTSSGWVGGQVSEIEARPKASRTVSDQSRVFSVAPDEYYWLVNSSAYGRGRSGCEWSITITPSVED